MKGDALDPKALIREAYNIEGISAPECRSIFLDWALSLPGSTDMQEVLRALLERHAKDAPDHPMSAVLRDGLQKMVPAGRRGGRQGRAQS